VSFIGRLRFPRKIFLVRRGSYVELPPQAVFVSGDDLETEPMEPDMELPGFGGVRWELEPHSDSEFGNPQAYRVEVTLTNGTASGASGPL
jgi:hypothetical protein